ncbi:MAG: hypothetical protein ACYYKD_12700 [Rhodospirillales bacterium]
MTSTLTRSAARVYGVLTGLGGGSTDIFERLVPFFDPILRPAQGQRLDVKIFADTVRATYKWNFNADVAEAFIPALLRAGWLVADNPSNASTVYTVSLPEDISRVDSETSVEIQLREIAEQFKSFAESLSPLTALPLIVEEYEDMLIEWLLYIEAFSEHNIDFKVSFRKEDSGHLRQVIDIPQTTSLTSEQEFLCARFVQNAINTNPNISEILVKVSSIGLLTEAVQDFVKPIVPVETSNLVVYLDAPVALEFLNVSGKASYEDTHPIISELQSIGASVHIYSQSVDEIKVSLKAVLDNSRPTGPTAQALMRNETTREYVSGVAANPATFLEKLNVKVVYRTLDMMPAQSAYFSDEHVKDIYSALGFQQNPNARDHDSIITALVMRQRQGIENQDIFKSRFVVMTRNGLLAQSTRRKCMDISMLSSDAVPPVVHRKIFASAIWLRTGLRMENLEVPKRMLLATCERVLEIRPGIVEAVSKITGAFEDKDKAAQMNALISQEKSSQMFMDIILGTPSALTLENLPKIHDKVMQALLAEERQKGAEKVEEEKKRAQENLQETKRELQTIRSAHGETANQLSKQRREDRAVIEALCSEITKIFMKKRKQRMFLCLILAAVFSSPMLFKSSAILSQLSFGFAFVLAVLTLMNINLFQIPPSKATSMLEKTAKLRRLDKKLLRFKVEWNGERFTISDPSESSGELPIFDEE